MPATGQVVFIDAVNGWAVGGKTSWTSEGLWRTRDGGDSWIPVDLGIQTSLTNTDYYIQRPEFVSPREGVLPVHVLRDEDGERRLDFYTTQNAGGDWTLTATLKDPDLATFGLGVSIPWSAIDDSMWFVALNPDTQYLTRNRGQSWEVFPGAGLIGAKLSDVTFVSLTEGWGLSRICNRDFECSQQLFTTHDGGQTWFHFIPAP
jgi:hypothetical protein